MVLEQRFTNYRITTLVTNLAILVCRRLGHLYLACCHLDFHHLEWSLVWCHHVFLHQVCPLQDCLCLLPWGCPQALAVSGLNIAQQMEECTTTTLEPYSQHGSDLRRWTRYHPQCKGCRHQVHHLTITLAINSCPQPLSEQRFWARVNRSQRYYFCGEKLHSPLFSLSVNVIALGCNIHFSW